jgi:mRNA interferase RelE/StbE
MNVTLKKTFLKDLEKVTEPQKSEVKAFLQQLSRSAHLSELSERNIKKLRGKRTDNFFRIRFGDYRLGCEKRDNEIVVYRVLHRKDIYRYFP